MGKLKTAVCPYCKKPIDRCQENYHGTHREGD